MVRGSVTERLARPICFALSIEGELIRLIRAIALQAAVAAQFARDGALVTTKVEAS